LRKSYLLLAIAAVPLLFAGTAGAQVQQGPARGQVTMTVHTHSGGVLISPVQRLPFNFSAGDTFTYASRLCSGNAPFNDIGLDFIPDYPGVDDDVDGRARVRHIVQGTISSWFGTRGMVQGTIRTILCEGEGSASVATGNVLVSRFQASLVLQAPNDLHLYGGWQFSPTESTGTFRDIQGGGRMEARLTCLGSASCAPNGFFNDFVASTGNPNLPAGQLQPGMTGSYYDPTVGPFAGPTA
jgi:hypothetical protein